MSDVRLLSVQAIDDTDNGRVRRRLGWIERKRGFAAADEEYALADAGSNGVERNQRLARRFPSGRERLQDEQRQAGEIRVFHRRNDLAQYTRNLHFDPRPRFPTRAPEWYRRCRQSPRPR